MKDPCVVCGKASTGGRNGFSLCRKHCEEVEEIDRRRADERRAIEYQVQRGKFFAEYPEFKRTPTPPDDASR